MRARAKSDKYKSDVLWDPTVDENIATIVQVKPNKFYLNVLTQLNLDNMYYLELDGNTN